MGAVLAGHYHVVKPLGSGGFGQTFLARDSHLPGQPLCVVKQFKPRFTSSKSLHVAKRLFDLEAKALYQLGNHDQIPRLLAHFEQDGEFYLVQEYVEGWSLDRELELHGQLSEAEVVTILHDILHVLTFVHGQQVIHRDIKPSNLIRRKRDRRMVLIDFGAVKQMSAEPTTTSGHTSLTVAIGSPGYMPVEQQSSLPQFSSDVYAVGMVGLQALTGINPKELPKDDRTGEIDCSQLPISPEFAAVLAKMVCYDYRQRYHDAGQALQALLQTEAVQPGVGQPLSNNGQILPNSLPTTIASTLLQPSSPEPVDAIEDIEDIEDEETMPPNMAPRLIQFLPQVSKLRLPESNGFSGSAASGASSSSRSSQSAAGLSRQEYRNRQALLSKVKHYWIKGVLETSLHDQVLVVLGMEDRSEIVASPWNLSWQTQQKPERTLPQGTPIVTIFDQLGTGRSLLILGEPGAGKTTTLLQLSRELISRAELDTDHLIPVVLNLSSWAGQGQSIADWVVEELTKKYQVPKKIGQPWVEQQQLLLLLDGLDEVRTEHRDACVAAVNAFQEQYGTEMVVCSRIRDYEALTNRLNFQTAVYLRSLTPVQIQQYLDSLSGDLAGLKALLVQDAALQELAQSPLMLNIMVLAYQGIGTEDLDETLVVEERRRQLFNAYIERMFKRRSLDQTYSEAEAIGWLSWLAKQMLQQSQSIFFIEHLQPSWLQTRSQRRNYRIGTVFTGILMGVPFGIITGGMTNGILEGWQSGLVKGLMNGILFGLTFGLVAGLSKTEIDTVETLKWSWREARRSLKVGLKNGLPLGIVAGLIFGIISELAPQVTPDRVSEQVGSGLFLGMIGGVTGGIVGGVIYGLTHGLRGSIIETKTIPNQGIWRTLMSAGIGGLIGGVFDAIIMTLLYTWLLGWQFGIIYGLSYGFFGGFIAGFIFGGGQACLKHLVLRMILHRDRYIPWNYSRFLNHVAGRVFLQKVGGGYIFVHRLLLEHFAQMRGMG
jgi:serine/threonine protein kinase